MSELMQWFMPWKMILPEWSEFAIVVLFIAGVTTLVGGGHFLVDGSSKLARSLGIRPMIVGLTVVAFGTSMPEFLVSLLAALSGNTDVALGNIIGSNVSNIGLILGVSALVRPIDINPKILRFELPLVLAVSAYFWLVGMNDILSRLDGFTLVLGFVAYIVIVVRSGKVDNADIPQELMEKPKAPIGRNVLLIIVGVIGLSYGASWVVKSSVELSHRFGVPELVVGLTVVAMGTSLPELATSLIAAFKKESDLSIGNIIGSNIFNMMAIAGPSAMLKPLPVSDELVYNQIPVMFAITLLLVPLVRSGNRLTRPEGLILLISYAAIMAWWTLS